MSYVVPIGRRPVRAVVIRPSNGDRFAYTVAAMVCPSTRSKASYLDQRRVYGTNDLAEALRTARLEAARTGLPVIDLVSPPRRGPNGPSGGGGRMAA